MTVIATLITALGLESSSFTGGLDEAQKALKKTQKQFATVGANMTKIGAVLSAGITAPFVALVTKAMPAAVESAQATAQVTAALTSMGPVAGRTGDQLATFAGHLQDVSNFDDDDIMREVSANLLTFGNVAGTVFDRAEQAIVDISARMGTDLQAATIMVGKALNDPVKGLKALSRAGIQFTKDQKDTIRTMVEAGNTAGAQSIMLKELERQFGGAAKAQRDATPDAALQQQWRTLQEIIGGIALKVLPPLTNGLAGVLKAFNDLDPATQRMAMVGATIAAAIGPASVALGAVVSGIGKALPLIKALGLMGTDAGLVGLGAAGGPLAAIALAAGGVYLAYKHWGEIKTYTVGVIEETTKAADQISAKWREVTAAVDEADRRMGTEPKHDFTASMVQIAVDAGAAWNAFAKSINSISDQVDAALLPFVQAWDNGAKAVNRFSDQVDAAMLRAVRSVADMVTKVGDWMGAKLKAALDLAMAPIRAVKDEFFHLMDAVVGHSYVPDMVDQIGEHMRRLDAEMVAPARGAISKTAAAFKALSDEVRPLMDELFPEARAVADLDRKLELVERARRAGADKGGMTGAEADEARRRLVHGGQAEPGPALPDPDAIGGMVDATDVAWRKLNNNWDKIVGANDNLRSSFQDTVRGVTDSLRGLVDGIRSHDWLGALQGVLDVITQLGQSGLFGKSGNGSLTGLFGGGGKAPSFPGIPDWSIEGYRAKGGSVLAGKNYVVGERGPELLRMGGAGGSIVPNHQLGGARGGVSFDLRGAVMTSDLLRQMQGIANDTGGTMIMGSERVRALKGRQRLG